VHHVKIVERGFMASVPLFVGWFGMLGGGRLTDYCVGKLGLKWGRRLPWGGSRFLAVAAFLACPLLDFSPWAVVVAMSVVAFATDLGSASGWAFCQDVGGKNVGSVLGWGNMFGNLGATVSPILLGWVQDAWGYNVMFFVCAAAFVLAGVCGLAIDATKAIVVEESEA
jgi:nitrate/nitrite transporter NarK